MQQEPEQPTPGSCQGINVIDLSANPGLTVTHSSPNAMVNALLGRPSPSQEKPLPNRKERRAAKAKKRAINKRIQTIVRKLPKNVRLKKEEINDQQ